jgi:hypothetical protein
VPDLRSAPGGLVTGLGRQLLELDGVVAGPVSAEGGAAVGEVVAERAAGSGWVRKHVARIRYEDILLASGAGMASVFYDWVRNMLAGNMLRKSGAIIYVDREGKELERIQFFKALINEIVFPKFEASSKAPANMWVRLAPETTRWRAGSRAVVPTDMNRMSIRPWLASNFRFQLAGLDISVNKIAPLAVKIGPGGNPIEAGNLIIVVPEQVTSSFRNWHEDFVVKGNNRSDYEKTGSIQLLAPNLADMLFAFSLEGLGIVSLTAIAPGEARERQVQVEMYCNLVQLQHVS